MKKISLICFCLLQSLVFSQGTKLKTYLDTKQFYAPNVGNYLEVYMQFVSYSVAYKNEGNGLRAKVLISIEISDSSKTVYSDRYVLESPEAIDSVQDDFYEVLRVQLNPGKYSLKIDLLDVYKDDSEISGNLPISIEDFSKNTKISDVLVAEYAYPSEEQTNFDKSGYHIIPMLSSFYGTDSKTLPIYLELYGTEGISDSSFQVSHRIIDMKDATEVAGFTRTSTIFKSTVVPVFETINTAGVGSHLAAGTSVRLQGVSRGETQPAPLLGQDTDQILMDVLGLDSPALGKLHDAGVVAGPDRDPLVGAH